MAAKLNIKLTVILVIAAVISLFIFFDINNTLSLDNVKDTRISLQTYYNQNPVTSTAIFFFVYILMTAVYLPGATILTLAAGAVFDLWWGTVIVSFASTIGATLSFLISRYLLGDFFQNKYSHKLVSFNKGFKDEGNFYLLSLRLMPLFPFFLINILMGLTKIKVANFYLISQLGMLPGTVAYVFAGTSLASITTPSDIVSIKFILAMTVISIFPLLARKIVEFTRFRMLMRKFKKPKSFDYNLVIIGAGSAGLVSAYIAATTKAKVALIEKDKMGGDCLNTGCVPSKALIKSAEIAYYAQKSKQYGINIPSVSADFKKVMSRVQNIISKIEPHDSIERYSSLGVDCIKGSAKIRSPYEVCIGNKTLTTKSIIIATGSKPHIPDIPGLDNINYFTSDSIWGLETLPNKLLVIGGGPIGCELAQCFARLGSKVTIIQRAQKLLVKEDSDVSSFLKKKLENEGITVLTNCNPLEFYKDAGNYDRLICNQDGTSIEIDFNIVLLATGRKVNTENFGVEDLKIATSSSGTIKVDKYLRTNYPTIYACGDVCGPYQFTHAASHQAWYASVNALFGLIKKFKADYRVIPWCTFTSPEVARVGVNETEAKNTNINFETTIYKLDDLDRAIADGENSGFIKIITPKGSDKILGVTIVGNGASNLISEFILAMKHNLGLNKILSTIHIYPTLSEANKYAAGLWKKNNAPKMILELMGKIHKYLRS